MFEVSSPIDGRPVSYVIATTLFGVALGLCVAL